MNNFMTAPGHRRNATDVSGSYLPRIGVKPNPLSSKPPIGAFPGYQEQNGSQRFKRSNFDKSDQNATHAVPRHRRAGSMSIPENGS